MLEQSDIQEVAEDLEEWSKFHNETVNSFYES